MRKATEFFAPRPLSQAKRLSRRAALGRLGGAGLAAAVLATAGIPRRATADGVEVETNVNYGRAGQVGREELVLDVYRPPTREAARPAVIVVHGGGWTERSRADWADGAQLMAEAGYVVFNIDYRLMKPDDRNPWPDQFDDAQRAVRWVRANAAAYGVDPARVGAFGHSSGGQMVALLGTRETRDDGDPALAGYSSRVTCVVDLAGDMDLTIPYPQPSDNVLVARFLGGTPADVPEVYRDASPLSWVDEDTAPFLIIHGAADDANPVAHSRRMVEALHAAGVEVVYAEYPGLGHIDITDWALCGPETLAFLGRHLHPEE
jgi:acetyl esterase/lipase